MKALLPSLTYFFVGICLLLSISTVSAFTIPDGGPILFSIPCTAPVGFVWALKFNYATKIPQRIVYPLFPPLLRGHFFPPFLGIVTQGLILPAAQIPCFITPPPIPVIFPGSLELFYGDAIKIGI